MLRLPAGWLARGRGAADTEVVPPSLRFNFAAGEFSNAVWVFYAGAYGEDKCVAVSSVSS